jgi:beta-lactamase class A
MIVARFLLSAIAGTAAMAGLVGSVPPVQRRQPQLSTMEQPTPLRWIGAPLAAAQQALGQRVRQKAEQQQRDAVLTAQLKGRDIGVAILDRRTGRTYTYAGTKQFRTASIVKVDILATLLLQANRAGRSLSASEKQLASAMIERSDNDATTTRRRRCGAASAESPEVCRRSASPRPGRVPTATGARP